MTARVFYGFGSEEAIKAHISKVKSIGDLFQLKRDILASGTNLTEFKAGIEGVYCVDHAGDRSFRHIFMTRSAFNRLGSPTDKEADSYTVLDD